jgi:HK97 gp10 family phage protein
MSSVTVQVIGLQELERKLKALGPTIARKSLRSALVAGAKLIRKEAIDLAPMTTGRLRKAVYIKKMNKPNPFAENVIVGVRHGKKMQKVSNQKFGKQGLDAFYWTFN